MKKIAKRSKKSIESNVGNKFTRLYVGFDALDSMTVHDLIPRKQSITYTAAQLKRMQSVGNATIPVSVSLRKVRGY